MNKKPEDLTEEDLAEFDRLLHAEYERIHGSTESGSSALQQLADIALYNIIGLAGKGHPAVAEINQFMEKQNVELTRGADSNQPKGNQS